MTRPRLRPFTFAIEAALAAQAGSGLLQRVVGVCMAVLRMCERRGEGRGWRDRAGRRVETASLAAARVVDGGRGRGPLSVWEAERPVWRVGWVGAAECAGCERGV